MKNINKDSTLTVYVAGIEQDDGSITHLKYFTNKTWALKYAKPFGIQARLGKAEVKLGLNLEDLE